MSTDITKKTSAGELVSRDRAQRINEAMSENTRLCYRQALRIFTQSGYSIPCTPDQLASFLEEVRQPDGKEYSISALKSFKSGVGYAHRMASHIDPSTDLEVSAAIKAIVQQRKQRDIDVIQKQAPPLMRDDAIAMCLTKNEHNNRKQDLRDLAIIVLGRSGAFRRSELANIRLNHIMKVNEGMVIIIPYSKTDQLGEGDKVYLPRLHSRFCPVQAVEEWIREAEIFEGHLFRRIRRGGHVCKDGIHPRAIDKIIKYRAELADMTDKEFSAHSLRAGFATSAAKSKARTDKIKSGGRWRSSAYERYIRDAEGFADNPVADIW